MTVMGAIWRKAGAALIKSRNLLKLVGVVAVLAACASPSPLAEETVGERFRKVLADIDTWCRDYKLGPYLDPSDPEYLSKRRATDCNILKLQPRDWRTDKLVSTEGQPHPIPERWLATPEGRLAHSIKLPPPHDAPKDVYRPGMSGADYFQNLCREQAGEFAFEEISSVNGVRQERPWMPEPSGYSNIVFWTKEKGGVGSDAPQDYLVQPPLGGFDFLEVRLSEEDAKKTAAPYRVFFRDVETASKRSFSVNIDGRWASVSYIVSQRALSNPQAQFAYTWRGLWLPRAMEHGIEGFELIVFQAHTMRVLGFQRMFWRHLPYPTVRDPRMTTTDACPAYKTMKMPPQFVQSILRPQSR